MRWYFDYISPYAYLQSTRLPLLASRQPVDCVPVLFAGLLDHWNNVGPAEIAPKRDWTFKNAVWLAQRDNIVLKLPAHHPFNPLPLLRLGIALGNDIEVVQRLFRFVWADGHLPTDAVPFAALLDELNVSPEQLASREVKEALLANGQLAIERGVFGVPTIEHKDELFWGHEATDMALAYLDNNWPADAMDEATQLPQGPSRKSVNRSLDTPTPAAKSKEPRIPLKPIDLKEPAELVDAIRQRRGGELIELDRLLLYSTPLATGWNHFVGNIRNEFAVSHKLRELAMCTVAVVNKADYEFAHHAPIFIAAGGSDEKASALRNVDRAGSNTALFDEEELLTIKLATQMTRNVQVEEQLFADCHRKFSNTELVEIVATIAAYNMVSRFLVAFNLVP